MSPEGDARETAHVVNSATVPPLSTTPKRSSYDVVIVGGAVMGSSVAWFIAHSPQRPNGRRRST